jgi:hypothetical protein
MVDMISVQDERETRSSLRATLSRFPDEYRRQHDMDHEFPGDNGLPGANEASLLVPDWASGAAFPGTGVLGLPRWY